MLNPVSLRERHYLQTIIQPIIYYNTHKMRVFLSLVSVVGVSWALPQLQFGGPTDVDTRSFSEADSLSGRVPGAPSVGSAPAPSVQVTNEVRHKILYFDAFINHALEAMSSCLRVSGSVLLHPR